MSIKALLTVETPVPIFKTFLGNLLYSTLDLTEELVANAPTVFGQVDIENVIFRDFADLSLGKIQHHLNPTDDHSEKSPLGLRVNILSSRQKGRLGSNPTGLSVDTPAGRKVVTIGEYSKRISLDSFPAVIALADEIPLFAGFKAANKASARSIAWLKQLKASSALDWEKIYLFGVTGAFTYDQHSAPSKSISSSSPSTEIDQGILRDAKDLLRQGCNGLVVGGAGMGETLHQLGVAVRSVKQAASSGSASVEVADGDQYSSPLSPNGTTSASSAPTAIDVEKRVLVMVQEMDSIQEILLAVQSGGDLIGTNLPQLMTTAGLALTWNLQEINSTVSNDSSANSESSGGSGSRSGSFDKRKSSTLEEVTEDENPNKKQNISNIIAPIAPVVNALIPSVTDHHYARTGTTTTVVTTIITAHKKSEDHDDEVDPKKNHDTPEEFKHAVTTGGAINLWDKIHRKDLGPIHQNCSCHACKHHTRAYVHHLLHANEMLADILLYCHNQHQTVQLFNEIQIVRKESDLAFQEWSVLLTALMHDK